MNIIKYLTLTFLSVILAGCGLAGSKENIKKLPDNNKVLIISALADEYSAIYVGTTFFTNYRKTIDTSDWKMNTEIEKNISSEIKKTHFIPLIPKEKSLNFPPVTGISLTQQQTQRLKEVLKNTNVDTVMLISSSPSTNDFYGMTNQPVKNYGFYKREVIGGTPNYGIKYARVRAGLYDAKNLDEIAYYYGKYYVEINKLKNPDNLNDVTKESIREDKELMIELATNATKQALAYLDIIKDKSLLPKKLPAEKFFDHEQENQ